MGFFGIGLPELVVILVLALIVVGPQRLPEVAAQMGRTIRELRRYTSGLNRELMDSVKELEREYRELRGELHSVSGDLLSKAEALGRGLGSVSDEVQKQLKIDEPKQSASTDVAPPGGNGATAESPEAMPAASASEDRTE